MTATEPCDQCCWVEEELVGFWLLCIPFFSRTATLLPLLEWSLLHQAVWWGLRTPRLAGDPSLTSLMPLAWKQDLEQRAPEQGSAAALTKAALPKGSLLMFLNHNPQSPVSSLSPQEPSNKCLFCSSEFESPPKDSWYRIWYHKWDVTRLSWDLGEGKNWYENLVVHFHVRINSGLTCDPVEPWDSYCVLPEKH